MIKAGILGDDSLVCGELIRLLNAHPDVNLMCVASSQHEGCPVSMIHRALVGEISLTYVAEPQLDGLDVLFLCGEEGESRSWMECAELPEGLRVIDLGPDYRMQGEDNAFVYGLPEVNRKHMVHDCNRVSCPGDVATAVLLALLPLARNLMLVSDIHVSVAQGGGDGVACMCNPLDHGQKDEIVQAITTMQSSFKSDVNIMAVSGAFSSGVLAAVYMDSNVDLEVLRTLYDEYYADHNFTFVVDHQPDIIDVLGTGKCYLHLERTGRRLVVTAAIDGMLKGAASNAVHCMNLMFGLQECTGLKVK